MRKNIYLILLSFSLACTQKPNSLEIINKAYINGNFAKAAALIEDKLLTDLDSLQKAELSYKLDLMERIRLEFSLNEAEVKQQFTGYYPNLTDSMLRVWEKNKHLEMKVIDGKRKYFYRSVGNFFRINPEGKVIKASVDGKHLGNVSKFKQRWVPKYVEIASAGNLKTFDFHRIKVIYTLSLKPNVVPAGEIIKCWLPFPREGSKRLPKVERLKASQDSFVIAPNEQLQRSVYMEKLAVTDSATVFKIEYIVDLAAQWFNLDSTMIKPYNKNSKLYRENTVERPPQVIFSEAITKKAREIVGNETNVYKQVKKLYYWNHKNIPWAGALEYSTIDCIPEYVLDNMRGDCGMQTFLFLSMARSLGIPAKWQSGWYLFPLEKNLHDWAEVYFEGVGWVPVDLSFKLIDSDDIRIKEFYLNGIDSYRLIINDDFSQEFYPPKQYPRSEPYDFQRGEVEWKGGNLYFNKWTYNIQVEYLD